jgi:hypothetical protein
MGDGAFAIIHVNRLKRSHGLLESNEVPLTSAASGSVVNVTSPKKFTHKRNVDRTERKRKGEEVTSHSQTIKEEGLETYDTEDEVVDPPLKYERDPDWNPESSYLQRKLQNDSKTADVAYQLRSRVVNRSGRETAGGSVTRQEAAAEPAMNRLAKLRHQVTRIIYGVELSVRQIRRRLVIHVRILQG